MIYLDNSATTRPHDCVIERMAQSMREEYFNASAAYAQAMRLEKKVDECRRTVAGTLGTDEAGICFTSGGTESDNLALMGSAATWHQKGSILISMVEHPAVYETVKRLEAQGFEVKRMPVDKYGAVDLHAAEEMISENTLMISCMHVNNETGAIQPIEEISRRLKKANPNACMHVDGVQGYLRVPVHMKKMGIDLYSLSGHKIHGPKGIGVLASCGKQKLNPQMTGGGQQKGLRSGTCDAPSVLGLQEAVMHCGEEQCAALRKMKCRLADNLKAAEGVFFNGPDPYDEERSAPHILSVAFDGVRGEVLRNALEGEGILVSTGSACGSHKQKVSASLLAMGIKPERADGTIRVSLGQFNTLEEMDIAAEEMLRINKSLRRFQRR